MRLDLLKEVQKYLEYFTKKELPKVPKREIKFGELMDYFLLKRERLPMDRKEFGKFLKEEEDGLVASDGVNQELVKSIFGNKSSLGKCYKAYGLDSPEVIQHSKRGRKTDSGEVL